MTQLVYELSVQPDGPVVQSPSRAESLSALRRLREQLGHEVEIKLTVRRPQGPDQPRGEG